MQEITTLQQLLTNMNVSLPVLILLIVAQIWSLIWKILACWKSARKGEWLWFIALFVINTLGILEILYIFVFSKMEIFSVNKEVKQIKNKKVKRKK